MLKTKLMLAVPAAAMLFASMPNQADARTKTILKYGAIGLGAMALSNYAQSRSYSQPYYGGYGYSQPYYGGYYGYSQPYYGGYYNSYPSYGYGYNNYYGGYYGY